MANQIKFDLGSMIRQVEELAKAIEKLGISTQNSFSNMAASTGTLGRAVTDVSSTTPDEQNVTFLSGSGRAAQPSFARKSIDEAMENQARIDAYNAYKKGAPGYYEDQGVLRYRDPKQHSTTGTFIKNYGDIGVLETLKQKQQERLTTAEKKQAEIPDKAPIAPGEVVKPTRAALGYSAADIPRGLQAQSGIEKVNDSITKAINGLKQSNDDNAKISASILKSLQERVGEKNVALEKAKADFSADTSERKENTTQSLINALAELEKAVEDATKATKQAGGGDGGEPPKGGFGEKFSEFRNRFGAMGAAGLALATGVAQQYYGFQATGRGVVIGQDLRFQKAAADIAQTEFKRELSSVDMRSAENIVKYRGNMLYGGAPGSEFLGAGGIAKANEAAKLNFESIKEKDRAERSSNRIGAAAKILTGAGAAVVSGVAGAATSWTGAGAVAGAAGVMYGVNQIVGGIGDLRGDVASAASAREGFTGMAGAGAWLSGLSPEERAKAQAVQMAEDRAQMTSYSESLVEENMRRKAKDVFLIDKYLESKAATRAAVMQVGGRALSHEDLRRNLTYSQSESDYLAQEYKNSIKSGFQGAVEKLSPDVIRDAKMARSVEFAKSIDTGLIFSDDTVKPTSGVGPFANRARYVFEANEAKIEAQRRESAREPGARTVATSPWAALGVSEAEFIQRSAAVSNVMGEKQTAAENIAQTSRISNLAFAGLGDFNQLVGNLGALNQTTGLGNNEKKLEQIMATAVALGFDKSRTGQQFIGAVTNLSASLGITDTGAVGRTLGLGATFLSATGKANELSLAQAQKGAAEYAAFTSQTGGIMGGLKMRAAFRSGMDFGTGAGLLSGKSSEQTMSWLSELESGNITSRELKDLMILNKGDKAKVRAALAGQVSASGIVGKGVFDMYFGAGAHSKDFEKIKGLSGNTKAQAAAVEEMSARVAEIASGIGLDTTAAKIGNIQQLMHQGAISQPAARKMMDDAIKANKEKGIDKAAVSLQKYIDTQTRSFDTTNNKVDIKKYKEYLEAGGVAQVEGVTKENIDKLSDSEKERLNKSLEGLTMVDLAQGAEQAYMAAGSVQKVEITNWRGMVMPLMHVGLGENLGKAVNQSSNTPTPRGN